MVVPNFPLILDLNNCHFIKLEYSVFRVHTTKWDPILHKLECTLSHIVPGSRTIPMIEFNAECVKQIVDWMHLKPLVVATSNFLHFYKIARFLQIEELLTGLHELITTDSDYLISAMDFTLRKDKEFDKERPIQQALQPELTFFKRPPKILEFFVNAFREIAPQGNSSDVKFLLSFDLITALMMVSFDIDKKVPLIFMAIDWIHLTQPSKHQMCSIIQSIRWKSFAGFDQMYLLRYNIYLYLTKYYGKAYFVIYEDGDSEIIMKDSGKNPDEKKKDKSKRFYIPPDFSRKLAWLQADRKTYGKKYWVHEPRPEVPVGVSNSLKIRGRQFKKPLISKAVLRSHFDSKYMQKNFFCTQYDEPQVEPFDIDGIDFNSFVEMWT